MRKQKDVRPTAERSKAQPFGPQFIQCEWLVQDRYFSAARNSGVPGDQQRSQTRLSQPRLPNCLQAVHARHGIIDDQQVDLKVGFQNAKRRVAAARVINTIAERSQVIGERPSYAVIIVTQQDAGRGAPELRSGSGRRLADRSFSGARQPQFNRRPLAGLAARSE